MNPPELSETMPTSLTIVTSMAARAASIALPPASTICSPASAAASLGAAIATSGMPEGYRVRRVWRRRSRRGLAAEALDLGLEVQRAHGRARVEDLLVSWSAGTSQLTSNSMPSGSLAYSALVVP